MRKWHPAPLALAMLLPGTAAAQAPDPAVAPHWQALTRTDVEAAYRLLADNHPGAAAEAGDKAFVAELKAAHILAQTRAATVTGMPGYIATLGAFATAMGDGHIGSRPLFKPVIVQWPGFVAARRGAAWIVTKSDPKGAGADLPGARILACDGTPIDRWATRVLAFHTVTSVAALQVVYGRYLLRDDGNPFVHWPMRCSFEKNGKTQVRPLTWSKITAANLRDKYAVPAYGEAGFGVARWRQGYWIGLQSLSYEAGAVIAAARKAEAALRAAPYVVVDLRGNGGGDDSYGRALAAVLYGKARVDAVLGKESGQGGCDETWRASPGNIAADEKMAAYFKAHGETAGATGYKRAVAQMKAALAAGKSLTGPITCHDKTASTAAAPPSAMRGRVIVLTDSLCFSSCIGTMGFFHKLGALQVGVETGADTHYAEYRRITLPSGLSTFSTLQALMPDAPLHLGPYAPAPRFTFGGDIADTAAVKAWVAATVLPAAGAAR